MTNTIVCGVDKSDAANDVVRAATRLADALHARLVTVHVLEEALSEGEELLTSLRSRLPNATDADVMLVEGSPVDRLIQVADEVNARFLVVGARGRRSPRSTVLGSVARRLGTQAGCPVVVVPHDLAQSAFASQGEDPDDASVVCGVDGSGHAISATKVASGLAQSLDHRLLVVHALPDPKSVASYLGSRSTTPPLSAQDDARQRLGAEIVEEAVRSVDGQGTGIVETGPPWEVLESVAEREAGGLLVVAARGLGAVRAILFGSVAAQVAAAAHRPVVLVSEPAEIAMAAEQEADHPSVQER